jgi:hypothetical protein
MKTRNLNPKLLFAAFAIILLSSGILYSQTLNTVNLTYAAATTEEMITTSRPVVSVLPNPSSGPITVRFVADMGGKVGITVMTSYGVPLFVVDAVAVVGNNAIALDLTPYGPGNYQVFVSGAGISARVGAVIK